jgi:hypothetical protein
MKKMKKISLLLIFSAIVSSGLFAQGVSGGLKGGLNLSDQKYSGYPVNNNPDMRVGYHVGGFLSIMFSEAFGIQPELLFNSIGSKNSLAGTDVAWRFSYLTLPVMFKYSPIPILNFHAGPQISTLLSAKAVSGDNSDKLSNIKPVEFGVGVGLGLNFPAGLTADVRYNVGLSDIADDNSKDSEVTNNYLQLSVGYKLFGKK